MATLQELHQIIDEQSTQKYFIEHYGYRSNHMAHGLIALYKLNASKSRLIEFAKWYMPRLESALESGLELDGTFPNLAEKHNLRQLLGKRENYYYLVNHYAALLRDTYNGRLEEFIKMEFPKMADGMHCAALHPMIHIGYGFDIRSPTLLIEGMAYLHYSHIETSIIPVCTENRSVDILDALRKIKESDIEEKVKLVAADPNWMPSSPHIFLKKIDAVATVPALRDRIVKIVQSIKLPEWFTQGTKEMEDMLRLMETVLHWALTVYACAESRNDFFLLHGVTGGWGLYQILHTFTDPAKAFDCILQFLATLCSVYVTQRCPAINVSYLEAPPSCNLEEIRDETLNKTVDEHVYKLVQVCYDLGKTNQEEEKQSLYKVACRIALDVEFTD